MRKRLEELSGRMQPRFLDDEDHEQAVKVFDSEPGELAASPPISLAQQDKKIA
jgi:hypothetical protein